MRALAAAAAALWLAAGAAQAAGNAEHPHQEAWSFAGIFGKFEPAEVQRGLQVYLTVCASCHALEHLSYRHLAGIGYDKEQIEAIAAEWEVEGGFDEDGAAFMRPAQPADRFARPYANAKEAAAMNNGKAPPDLSLIVKARADGANYVYSLLTGYADEAPEGLELGDGLSYNPYFNGHQIAMPPPLWGDDVEYADGTETTIAQEAHDVTAFLAWAAEPELAARKSMGLKVILFLLVMTALFYATKRKVWSKLH